MALLQRAEPFPLTPTAQAALDRAAELYKPPWSTKNVKGEFDITEKKKKKPETEEKTRFFMPYEVPEAVVRDPRALDEDKTIRHFVPLSDRRWYKTLIDQTYELPARTERSAAVTTRPRRRRVPLGQTYVVPLPPRITEQYGPRWRVPSASPDRLETLRTARRSPSPDSEDEPEPLGFFSASPAVRYERTAVHCRDAEKVERRRAVEEVTETTKKKHTVSQLTGRRRSLSPTYIELMRPVSELIRAPRRPPVEVEGTARRSPIPERTRARSPSPVGSVERSSRSSSSGFEGSALHFDSPSSPHEARRSALKAERTYQEVTQTPFSLDHAPRVTVRMRSHRVPTGQDTKFTLNVRARPDGEITWCHNGVQITESSKYVFTNMTGVLTIAILDCQAEDSGTYRCTCTNAKGEASDYGTLDVTRGEFTAFSSRRKDEEAKKAYLPEMTRVDHFHRSHSKAGYSSKTFI